MSTLSGRIQILIDNSGLSAAEFARRATNYCTNGVKITRQDVTNWVGGYVRRISDEKLVALSRFTGATVSWIQYGTNDDSGIVEKMPPSEMDYSRKRLIQILKTPDLLSDADVRRLFKIAKVFMDKDEPI